MVFSISITTTEKSPLYARRRRASIRVKTYIYLTEDPPKKTYAPTEPAFNVRLNSLLRGVFLISIVFIRFGAALPDSLY